jgi:hypothetical protein
MRACDAAHLSCLSAGAGFFSQGGWAGQRECVMRAPWRLFFPFGRDFRRFARVFSWAFLAARGWLAEGICVKKFPVAPCL